MEQETPSMKDRPHVLYRMFTKTRELLYVGISVDVGMRFGQHADDKPWWAEVNSIELEHHDSRAAALAAERTAIIAERPVHNVVHRDGGGAGRHRSIRMESSLWDQLANAATGLAYDRSALIRQLIRWWLGVPGAQLPQRPAGLSSKES